MGHRLSPNQIQKLLNQYLVADYEQPINGEIMKAVASRVTEKSDVLLLQAVDMDDSGPYEIAEPRVITALETYTPSCELPNALHFDCQPQTNINSRAPNPSPQAARRDCLRPGHRPAGEDGVRLAGRLRQQRRARGPGRDPGAHRGQRIESEPARATAFVCVVRAPIPEVVSAVPVQEDGERRQQDTEAWGIGKQPTARRYERWRQSHQWDDAALSAFEE